MSRVAIALIIVALVGWHHPAAAADRYSAILVDANSGEVLAAEKPDVQRFPASLTKIMTLYMVFDALKSGQLELDQTIPVSPGAARQRPSVIGLRAGERITVEQAIAAVVTKSANDAAVVLAEAVAGSEARFAKLMTERAQKLGMTDTVFRNASGLPHWRQRTTARDMVMLSLALFEHHGDRYQFFSLTEFTWKQRNFNNHNQLLEDYEGADGIKTGYIRASGFNLVASAERDGRRLIGVMFGAASPRDRDQRMAELLDYGFSGAASESKVALPTIGSLIGSAKAAAVAAEPPAPWAIQLGSFTKRSRAQRQAGAAAALAPVLLKDHELVIVHDEERGRTTYRPRLVGFDEADARKACRELQRRKLGCIVVPPDNSGS